MPLTSISDARTPGQALEIAFAAQAGLPSADRIVCLIGHKHATSGTATANTVYTVQNCADVNAATTEANAAFGAGTTAAKMVIAAVKATVNVGGPVNPQLKVLVLASTDTAFAAPAFTALDKIQADYIASPYASSVSANLTALKAQVLAMSAAGRVDNGQYGSFGVIAEIATAVNALPKPDTSALILPYLRDSTPAQAVYEVAAAAAAAMAANPVPFNPQDKVQIGGLNPPTVASDYLTVGPSDESEQVLLAGFTPLRVLPNGTVAFVRTITSKLSLDGSGLPVVSSYYDNQDYAVLYLWRRTLVTRFSQPDFNKKNDDTTMDLALSEMIRLAKVFQKNNMFQAVDQLSKLFVVQRSLTDRSAFEYKTPVNVIPGLHRKLGRIEATTEFDTIVL